MEWNNAEQSLPEVETQIICRIYYTLCAEVDYGCGFRSKVDGKIKCDRTGCYKITHWMYDNLDK